ncbi:MAG: hypothetical protein ACE144_18175 [Thermodesulfobacteriota bacterium]
MIVENYRNVGVDVAHIVRRILSHLSPEVLEGLHEVRLLERHDHAFACYKKAEGAIEIYLVDLLGFLPPIFWKAFYPFTYLVVGIAVAHELDHHVNRLLSGSAAAPTSIRMQSMVWSMFWVPSWASVLFDASEGAGKMKKGNGAYASMIRMLFIRSERLESSLLTARTTPSEAFLRRYQ